ncbi:hypothetical protein [Massilia pseudoviolaceinigra]|uniref:hypothetical protein n=1 Tax=Massilia pseudoviolaceinigra TaxID=3057165 RepID=UPI00279681D9|nr:hypothetical protein [Massilia sp. CCM 9206]MDQ1918991.1 hypothetical protein [Massilia sp. CCM 9206]
MFMNKNRCMSASSSARASLVRFIGMMLLCCFIPPAFAQESAANTSEAGMGADPVPMRYGQIYHVQNGYMNWTGGYLDVRDSRCNGNTLCVSTAKLVNRDRGSGSWMILPVDVTKRNGDPVIEGDHVYVINQYPATTGTGDGAPGGYLDARGEGCQSNVLCVSTSLTKNTSASSSSWQILPAGGVPTGQSINLEQEIHLLNRKVINDTHTYLDVRGNSCQSNFLCVSTSIGWNRDKASGSWRFLARTPSP